MPALERSCGQRSADAGSSQRDGDGSRSHRGRGSLPLARSALRQPREVRVTKRDAFAGNARGHGITMRACLLVSSRAAVLALAQR